MTPQTITAPDGSELVVITRAEFDRLVARAGDDAGEDAADIAAADRARTDGDVRYPAAVVDAMIARESPIAAWRNHRGMSQATLAERSGLTQAAVSRLERSPSAGLRKTRLAIARALDVPLAAIDPLDD